MRLLFTFAGNEGHLQLMRSLVLPPFPPSKGDHVDPLGPTTHFFQFHQELDSLPPHRYWISSPAGQRSAEQVVALSGHGPTPLKDPRTGTEDFAGGV